VLWNSRPLYQIHIARKQGKIDVLNVLKREFPSLVEKIKSREWFLEASKHGRTYCVKWAMFFKNAKTWVTIHCSKTPKHGPNHLLKNAKT
jgi:hypothetical protein